MGPERDVENPHRRRGSTPKLSMAGQIVGVVDGRPMSLTADEQDLVLTVHHWRTLRTIRRCSRSLLQSLHTLGTRSDIRLFIRIRWLGRIEVHPKQPFWVRMLLPRA